uniref:Pre-SET domain-containing protein n=1 Tax=Physcomitrium patens TaxID=3218 RepID=A0A2K1K751_PHYPA|nr:hypothetical protein PHYPA_011497 [Physcomitrium patens]
MLYTSLSFREREGNRAWSLLFSSLGLLLTCDIFEDVEQIPICVVNVVEVDTPDTFNYITTVNLHKDVLVQTQAYECHFGCKDSICPCVKKYNASVLGYNDYGHLILVHNIVYELGSFCNCSHAACQSRVS